MTATQSATGTATEAPALFACLEQLIAGDVAAADRVMLDRLVGASHRLRGFLDAADVKIAARAGELAAHGSVLSAADVLGNRGRCSKRDARRTAARAEACNDIPGLTEALESGAASGGHVDAVVSATAGLDEQARAKLAGRAGEILDAAATLPVDQFSRRMSRFADDASREPGVSRQQRLNQRRCVKRWTDHTTGMHVTHLELAAEDDAKVWAAIRAGLDAERRCTDSADERNLDQHLADVLVGLITGSRAVDQRVPEISVLVDIDTLRDGPHDGTVAETSAGEPLDVEAIRRLGCEGDLAGILLDPLGTPLAVGRTRRLATIEQRQAARSMYRACGFPGCTVPFEWCRLHHVAWWTRDRGVTDLDNLIPLCSGHHHLVHEGGWTLQLHADRTVTVQRPDGSSHFTGDTADRRNRSTAPTACSADRRRRELEPGEPGFIDQLAADLEATLRDETARRSGRPPP